MSCNTLLSCEKLQTENQYLREELREEEELIGTSPVHGATKVADFGRRPFQRLGPAPRGKWNGQRSSSHVRYTTEARAPKERFVAVNCAAIPDELIERELFGHEKGSFTGAHDRKIGKFEQAHGGTLFLDEVGDMGPKMQAKILRALQENVIQRVGETRRLRWTFGSSPQPTRISAASIRNGEFREDLYYRLNVIPIHRPASEGPERRHS